MIATGIETPEQIGTLRAMRCTLAQGPALGPPVAADAVESLLDAELQTQDASSVGTLP